MSDNKIISSAIDAYSTTESLHKKFVEYGSNAKEWQRKCVLLLPEIDKRKVWSKQGFNSIYEYAAKLAGMSRGQVEDALYILRKIKNKPALLKVAKLKGINAIRPVVAIATEKDERFWAGKAGKMTQQTLKTYVRDFRQQLQNESASAGFSNLQVRVDPKDENKIRIITIQLSKPLADKLEKLNEGQQDWEKLMQKFVEIYEKDQAKQKILKKEKFEIKKATSRNIPAKIKLYILKRSGGLCEFPSCNKKYDHLHHTNRYSSNKIHNPNQIVALCAAHHDLAHEGLIQNENEDMSNWKVREKPDLTDLNSYIDQQFQWYKRIPKQFI